MKKLVLLLISAFMVTAAMAQVTTSSITGRVVDQNGDVLIGATVQAVHTPTGTRYATSTVRSGSFNISGMRVGGPYELEVSYIGYNPEKITGVYLTLGEEAGFNVVMSEESQRLSDVVVVGSASPVFNSTRTGAQEVITNDKMQILPSLNRSLSDFTKLTPMSQGNNFAGASYRFNNVTVDGASFNNSFGLSDKLGAGTTQPISLESIDQIQVMIAPYDVRNGGFTGGGINSVTKSGTNEFKASAYYYTKSPSMTGYRVKDEILNVTEFADNQYGISLAGPIIKNKLFAFLNYEADRIEYPVTWTTETPGNRVEYDVLKDLSDFMQDNLGYNPGQINVSKRPVQADRITARIDWNINSKHTLSFKYYYLKSFSTSTPSTSGEPAGAGRGPNEYSIPFGSTYYRSNNNFNIFMVDLNSNFSSKVSNTLTLGYSRLRDFRDMDGGFFPQVDILDGTSQNYQYTMFGTERNSYNNQLDSDIFQIQDNLTFNLGKHQLVVGTQSDYRKFKNGYAQNYPGAWLFNSIEDFKFNVLATQDYMNANGGSIAGFDISQYTPGQFGIDATTPGGVAVTGLHQGAYTQKYSLQDGFPFAEVDVLSLGFYVQDRWTINDKLNLTLGVRMDMPIFLTDLPRNEALEHEVFRDGIQIDVSKYPNAKPIISPRLGFNWRPLEDNSLQVRGGTGIFTGTPPYVWLSNQAGNNGVLFGDYNVLAAESKNHLGFTGDINSYKPTAGSAPQNTDISITDPDFKYPSLWKSNIAVDYKFHGWIATVEMLYSKDINAIYHDNIGIYGTGNYINDGSPQRAREAFDDYYSNTDGNQQVAKNVIMLRNTNKGYSFFTTFQLQKQFTHGPLKGFYVNASYTTGKAKAVTDGSSSVALSAWQYRPAVNPNSQELGYTSGSFDGRLLLTAAYTRQWSKNNATNVALTFDRFRFYRYSYTYSGHANGDGINTNDLIYIPRNYEEIKANLVAGDFASVEDAWNALDAFIEQDPYLSKNRGKYAERNGGVRPFANNLDFHLSHDISVFLKNGKENKIRFSFNISNFLNLLNRNWGVRETSLIGAQQVQILRVRQTPSADNGWTLQYSPVKELMSTPENPRPGTFKTDIGSSSRWAMQFGIRYTFN